MAHRIEESRRRAMEDNLIQQWKEIEDLESEEGEDEFKSKKEQWFFQAFSFLRDLPEESHCWCGHKEIMLPILEPFYGYFHETSPNSSLKVLWRRLSKEMRACTRCVVQHHKAKEFYASEFVEEVVKPLLDVIRALDEERVAQHMKELLHKFNTDTLDPREDSLEVICVMFEVLMFPSLLDDAEVNETVGPFLLHVEETHDLSLAAGQRYPGVYSLLLHRDQGVRRIAVKLANSLPVFKDENDMESIQPMLGKCMHCLEYDSFVSSTQEAGKAVPGSQSRPRATFTKEALWIGLTTLLNFLEPPAFLKGVMEKHPMFISVVLNHISEMTAVFWNALRCLKLLLEVLGYKLWLGTTFSPGVMRNTLLSQCFNSREERMHVHVFDLFQPFLKSLEALQDGEYENQRRRLLYFLLQQVPLSSNFKPLITKKARQVAFSIIGRGYTMDPPLAPVECVHFWGPPLVATLKDTGLITSLKKSAIDLMQCIIVADASSLAAASTRQACLRNSGKYSLDSNDNDGDETVEEIPDKRTEEPDKYWSSFSFVTRSVEACEQWFCLPLLWVDVLGGILPMYLPLSFTKGIMWALSRLSIMDLEGMESPTNTAMASDSVACSRDIAMAFMWVKPKGCEDGASGEGCVNAVKAEAHHEELVRVFKRYAEKYLSNLHNSGFEQGIWQWEARLAEPCILLPLDANAAFRDFGKDVLRRLSNGSSLEAGLGLLCSSEASAAAVIRGLHHALKQLLHWPLSRSSRGLQQLFFHVWKLLTLGDKEPERQASEKPQDSQNGGFLSQPNFQALTLKESSQATPVIKLDKDEAAWRMLCTQIASQLWPLLVKTIIEGRQHLEGAGQLMTFTRMLQLLPCVFKNLNAAHKKKIFLGMNGRKSTPLKGSFDSTWFHAFIRWSDVPSPIIQRWWKEAVCSILEDLKERELVLPSQLEDVISDLRKPGLELDEQRRLQLTTLLLSVPNLVLGHQFFDREILSAAPSKNENAQNLEERWDRDDEPDCVVLDVRDSVKPRHHVIDLTDSPERSSFAPVHRVHLNEEDDAVSSPPKQLDSDLSAPASRRKDTSVLDRGSELGSSRNGRYDWPERPQFRQPSQQQRAPVASQKTSTLDNFLARFYKDKQGREADRETNNKGGFQVQARNNVPKLPAKSSISTKLPNKVGSKLSSLRSEHREVLEQRSAVEGFVRNQVRERVEKEARAKQSATATVGSLDHQIPFNVPAPDDGSDAELMELRELVQDNEVDPLDAALDTVRKPRLVGLTEPMVKPRRKLITLEMPGEGGRGGALGRTRAGLVINPRQIPRLDLWYKRILSLDYLSVAGISDEAPSPGSIPGERLEKVPLTFQSPEHYMNIFRPLVLEEFKSQLQRSHTELNLSDASTTGILRLMSLERVDEFQLGRFVSEAGSDGAARACADNELLLLSRQALQSGPQSCHILAKMESRDRESKSRAVVLLLKLYVPAAGDLRLSKAKRLLVDRSKWYMTRIMNMTPQIREWQALSSLSSLPLLPVLLSPSPGHHQTKSLDSVSSVNKLRCLPDPLQSKLRGDYNESQLRAIANAIGGKETMTNDHQLTLVQGPPGTGKTKTIVAILSVLLALRSSKKKTLQAGIENQPPTSRSNMMGMGDRNSTTIKSSSRDAAAMSRAWQDAARAKEMMKESERYSPDLLRGQKQRILVCAQSNAAVDEIVARICKNGLYGVDGKFFKPSVVRIGTLKSVHPRSLPVFIDTLVEQRLGSEKESDPQAAEDKEQTKLAGCRSKLEEVIEFIQVIESLRSQSHEIEGEKNNNGHKAGLSESVFADKALNVIAQGESAVTAKLNLLYNQRRALTAEVATAEKEGKKAYEESKNMRKSIRKDIIRQADVVVTTLSGSGGDIYSVCMESVVGGGKKSKPPIQECFFDAVVIDEAAQALEPATLIPLQLLVQTNARCVMVGDPKQLPATVLSQMASRMQYECSMFERLQRAGFPVTMLSTQYRMHPEIRQFPSAHFYDDRITDGDGLKAARKAIFHRDPSFGPYVFFNVVDGQESSKGSSASQSLSNKAEVAVAVELYAALRKRYPAELWEGRVGVITPYKQQLRLLQEEFGRALGSTAASEIEFNTVDGFQGREVDIVILTTVRASSSGSSKPGGDIGFVADLRRMNVGLTRARFSMWIIGNAATLRGNSSWASLLSNAEKRALTYSVQKPYASFFQKSRPVVDTSHSSRAHKSIKLLEDGQANGDVTPGRTKGNRIDFEERERTQRIREQQPNEALVRKGDKRSPDHASRQVAATSSIQNGISSEQGVRKTQLLREDSHNRRENGPRSEMKRSPTGQDIAIESSRQRHESRSVSETKRSHSVQDPSRERSRDRHEDRSATETKRSHHSGRNPSWESSRDRHEGRSPSVLKRNRTGQDRMRTEGEPRERRLEDNGKERLHQGERSGNKEKVEDLEKRQTNFGKEKARMEAIPSESLAEVRQLNKVRHEGSSGSRAHMEKETAYNERTPNYSKKVVMEAESAWRSHSVTDTGDASFEGKYPKQDGPAAAAEELLGLKKRQEKESISNLNRNREGQNLGERRDDVDKRHRSSSGETAHVRDHRLKDKGADSQPESTQNLWKNAPGHSRVGDERKQPATDERQTFKQGLENGVTSAVGAGRSEVGRTGSQHRRSSQEELQAARKRKRDEVAALLPSSLLTSTEGSRSSVPRDQKVRTTATPNVPPAPLHRARTPTIEPAVRQRSGHKDMNQEWAKFEAALALGESKSAQPGANPRADSAPRVPSKRPAPKQSKPASDLDNILSGLSSVTWAQAKGGKLDAPPKSGV